MDKELAFRYAQRGDVPLILRFLQNAGSGKQGDTVLIDEATLEHELFDRKAAEVLFALVDGSEVGFALFFCNFSTFLGKAGICVDELFVLPGHGGNGYAEALARKLAGIAVERGYGRLEWFCGPGEQREAVASRVGAEPQSEWTLYRVSGNALSRIAD